MRFRNARPVIIFLAWTVLIIQASFFAVPRTALGATETAAIIRVDTFDLLPYAISEVTGLPHHTRLSSTPKIRTFGSLALETGSAVQAPCLVTTFQQTHGVIPRHACEHIVTCDRSPPAASLEP